MTRIGLVVVLVLWAVPSVAAEFRVSSLVVKDKGTIANEQVFNGFGCTGANISPELTWETRPKTPRASRSRSTIDAPTGSGWWHWVIFNIPPAVTKLPANAGKPDAGLAPVESIQSMTDFGAPGYGGPCPPAGDKPHRYIFTVYALKVDQLPLKAEASGAMVGFYLGQNSLGKASFTATYGR
jgi:Raf kinase inhibitor-like YbhB/YbcL family protein